MKCKPCKGIGYHRCEECAGEGIVHGSLKCRSCNGEGMITCGACGGKGKVSLFKRLKSG